MKSFSGWSLGLVAVGVGGVSCGGGASAPTPPAVTVVVGLRADTNRDGVVDVEGESDAVGREKWDAKHGGVFLANLDDDTQRCRRAGADVDLPKCNDAEDEVVNGELDLLDIARIKTKPWADAPPDTVGTLVVSDPGSGYVRLFKRDGEEWNVFDRATGTMSATEIARGVEFGIEGKDIVRDADVWNGYVDVTLHVVSGGLPATATHAALDRVDKTDTVQLRIAPVITYHHLQPAEKVYAANLRGDVASTDFRAALVAADRDPGAPPMVEIPTDDQWAQDYFEPAFMSLPAAGGTQHVIRVNYRSANIVDAKNARNPLRVAGKVVFTLFRGPDVAGVQEFDKNAAPQMDSLNSYGNLETIPPYSKGGTAYPLGRVLRGSVPGLHPDAKFAKLFASQAMQPAVFIDTSWLAVGHVDETVSFVKAGSPRGWVVLANDPRLAKTMLENQVAKGNGGVKMFIGLDWLGAKQESIPAERTIAEVLADTDVMATSAQAVVAIDAQLEVLKKETGITDDEIIRIPFLHMSTFGRSIAYQPGTVNGLYLADNHFAAPEPHGPVIGGKDIMKDQFEQALAKIGITVHWIEDWDLFHRLDGEVHCGTNSMRKVPEVKWWETGR